ncbi:MAG: hypothetical protein WC794_01850 [Candidatus Doudnabacteria bacterium]|jgi:hypothetical protein
MQILLWIVGIILIYFFVVFVFLRLVVPFMGFKQNMPKVELPQDMKIKIVELENKSQNQLTFLQGVYDAVLSKTLHQWQHTRFKAAFYISKLFVTNLADIWQTKGFLYCNTINFVGFNMLVNSKFFTASDIKVKYVFLNFVLHQYLQVKVGESWIDFDPAGSGIRNGLLGAHASLFG